MKVTDSSPFPAGTQLYSYLRHSPGDNQSIDSQEAAVREWCTKHQLVLARVYKDEARTGSTTAGRDQFLQLIDTLREPKLTPRPSGIVLWSFSRFARDYDDAEFYKADLRRRGYVIHSLTDQIPDGPFGRVIESITHWKDEERLREISKDAQRGLQWLAQQGYSVGGFPPVGFKKSAAIEVGHKKNGEPRLAHKWKIDPETEVRVRKAWQMKLAGELNWTIHHETHVFDSINCYSSFFRNQTYAGFRKCASLIVPDAHPAYVSKEDFDRIQARRQPKVAGQPNGSALGYPGRRAHNNPYWLSGVLHCGYCGGAMVGNRNGQTWLYRCGRRQRRGADACTQPEVVAHALHKNVVEWLTKEVITFDHLLAAREALTRRLSVSHDELQQRQQFLQAELVQVQRKLTNLLNAVEESGWSQEIDSRLAERKAEKAKLEMEQHQIAASLKQAAAQVSNEALQYLAQHLSEQIHSGDAQLARGVVQKIIKRAEIYKERMVLQYVPPLVELNSNELVGFRVCPHGNSNPGFGLERAAS